ncbi:YCF48-related protein [Pseudomonas silvicola]|nr:YCF48-related protein [Pseudomonas silvicola]
MNVLYSVSLGLLCASLMSGPAQAETGFKDPLDVPALQIRNVESAHFSAVTAAGSRLIAVGAGGMIAISDDQGTHWTQVQAPASSDLLAVFFPTAQQGWAVGHDGLVMHSADGGNTWVKQFDGLQASQQLLAQYSAQAQSGDADAQALLDGVKLNYQDGPEQALMDVWFADALNGFVVGTFGTLFATQDGGKTWTSWMERVDNPEFLHFLAISGDGDNLYIASERGVVFKLDKATQRFVTLQTGYAGTFFAISAAHGNVVAAGLRGSVFSSADQGQSWRSIPSGTATALTGVQALADGRYLLSSVDGRLLLSDAGLKGFTSVKTQRGGRFTSVAQNGQGSAVTVGYSGVRLVELN